MPFEAVSNQIKNNRDEILAELQHSLESNNAIGILLKDSKELITTAVAEIEEDAVTGNHLVILREQDLHGYPIYRNKHQLSNIERVIRFNIPFDDPQYVNVRRKEKLKA